MIPCAFQTLVEMNQCRKTDFSDNWGNGKNRRKKEVRREKKKKKKVEIAGENEITKRNLTKENYAKASISSLFLIRTVYVKFHSDGLEKVLSNCG